MDDRTVRDIYTRIKNLRSDQVRYRQGEITDTDPLSVALGGSDIPIEGVKALDASALSVGDVVAVATFGNDLLILGPLGDGGGPRAVGFHAYRNAALTQAQDTAIPFDSEVFDTDGWYDPSTGRYTPLIEGYYRLNARVQLNAALGADEYIIASIRKNGNIIAFGALAIQRGSVTISGVVITPPVLADGIDDYFTVTFSSNNGGSHALFVGTTSQTFFGGELIGHA